MHSTEQLNGHVEEGATSPTASVSQTELAEALRTLEAAALSGVVLDGDDIPRLHATADRIAPLAAHIVLTSAGAIGWQYVNDDGVPQGITRAVATPDEWMTDGSHRPVFAEPPPRARTLMADMRKIAEGSLPDGDSVNTSVALWAERWLERLPREQEAEINDLRAKLSLEWFGRMLVEHGVIPADAWFDPLEHDQGKTAEAIGQAHRALLRTIAAATRGE